jgi:hypothetical protein
MDHDGMKSRKFILAAAAFLIPFGVATAAMFMGSMSADQWIELTKHLGTTVPGLYGLANVGEYFATRDQ